MIIVFDSKRQRNYFWIVFFAFGIIGGIEMILIENYDFFLFGDWQRENWPITMIVWPYLLFIIFPVPILRMFKIY